MKTHKTIRTERVGALAIRYAPCGATRRTMGIKVSGANFVEGDEAPTCQRCAGYFIPMQEEAT